MLTGTIGARLRVPFTVLARSSFGFWFSYFSVISLIILSMFWFGIQTYIGSECVYQVRRPLSRSLPRTQLLFIQILKAIWPSIAHLPNHLPANANITSSGMFHYLSRFQQRSYVSRNALLFYLLVHSVSFLVHLAPETTISLPGKINHSTAYVVSSAHMGICEGTPK